MLPKSTSAHPCAAVLMQKRESVIDFIGFSDRAE
jgi:hypothetical protein